MHNVNTEAFDIFVKEYLIVSVDLAEFEEKRRIFGESDVGVRKQQARLATVCVAKTVAIKDVIQLGRAVNPFIPALWVGEGANTLTDVIVVPGRQGNPNQSLLLHQAHHLRDVTWRVKVIVVEINNVLACGHVERHVTLQANSKVLARLYFDGDVYNTLIHHGLLLKKLRGRIFIGFHHDELLICPCLSLEAAPEVLVVVLSLRHGGRHDGHPAGHLEVHAGPTDQDRLRWQPSHGRHLRGVIQARARLEQVTFELRPLYRIRANVAAFARRAWVGRLGSRRRWCGGCRCDRTHGPARQAFQFGQRGGRWCRSCVGLRLPDRFGKHAGSDWRVRLRFGTQLRQRHFRGLRGQSWPHGEHGRRKRGGLGRVVRIGCRVGDRAPVGRRHCSRLWRGCRCHDATGGQDHPCGRHDIRHRRSMNNARSLPGR
mmetsp:Transcript_28201/g.67047  ORF Transcript_28201/g.67047 Transcript_28201/m.67047 type:complete len:428 (+) Transcript_28201:387-1670(+)